MDDLFLLQSSVVGTFPMDSDKRPVKGLHAWTIAQGDQVKQVNSYKQVKNVASAKALNVISEIHGVASLELNPSRPYMILSFFQIL